MPNYKAKDLEDLFRLADSITDDEYSMSGYDCKGLEYKGLLLNCSCLSDISSITYYQPEAKERLGNLIDSLAENNHRK